MCDAMIGRRAGKEKWWSAYRVRVSTSVCREDYPRGYGRVMIAKRYDSSFQFTMMIAFFQFF
jgi:hypothetical protein